MPHKLRRGIKRSTNSDVDISEQAFPLASLLWPARNSASQWNTLPLILMIVGLFRWAASLWDYSGL